MPKIVPALTATAVRNAKPAAKPYLIFDGAEAGLHLHVSNTGKKTFRLKSTINGEIRRITLGDVSNTTLAEAREKASDLKKQIKSGIDPTVPAKTEIEHTFEAAAEMFVKWKAGVLLRSGATIRKYRDCMKNDLIPNLGHMDIAKIHVGDIVPVLEQIERRSNSLARKNQELISMIIRYSIQRGYRPPYTQPDLTGIVVRAKSKPKKIPLDLPATYNKINEYEEEVMRHAMKLQFLCFTRSAETMGAEWREIDWTAKEWHIPASRMKMRRPHVIPLASQTLNLLNQLKKLTGDSEFLFPSKHNETHLVRDSLSKAFRAARLGIVPHGCRTAAGTWMKNNGFAPHLVEFQLAHVQKNATAGAYEDRPHLLYLTERKKMMQAWADFITQNQV